MSVVRSWELTHKEGNDQPPRIPCFGVWACEYPEDQ